MRKTQRNILPIVILLLIVAGSAAAQPLFWKVSTKKATVYLLGSIHLADQSFYPLPDPIEKAFSESSSLVVELDPDSFSIDDLIANCSYRDNTTIVDHLSKPGYTKVRRAFNSIKLPDFMWKFLKPFPAALVYSNYKYLSFGVSPEFGIDLHFINQARTAGKEIVQLEDFIGQTNLFDKLSDSLNEVILLKSIAEVDSSKAEMATLIEAWKNGDEKTLTSMFVSKQDMDSADSVYNRILLDERNAKMIDKIEAFLKSKGTFFVVVGTAHLLGENGIVQTLKKNKKYKTVRVK